jgi:hypothetical protein
VNRKRHFWLDIGDPGTPLTCLHGLIFGDESVATRRTDPSTPVALQWLTQLAEVTTESPSSVANMQPSFFAFFFSSFLVVSTDKGKRELILLKLD